MKVRRAVLTLFALRASAFSFAPPFSPSPSSASAGRTSASAPRRRRHERPGRGRIDAVRWSFQRVAASASVVGENEAEEQGGGNPQRSIDGEEAGPGSSSVAPRPGRSASKRRTVKAPRFVQAAHYDGRKQVLPPRPSRKKQAASASDGRRVDEPPEARGRVAQEGGGVGPTTSSPPPAASRPVTPKLDKDRMWKRSRTIEELESALMSRWGTDARQWTDYDDTDDDEDDDTDDDLNGSEKGDRGSSQPAVRARPVYDPWGADDDKDAPRKDRESSGFRVSDLIRDKPVGGRGVRPSTTDPRSSPIPAATNPGFFFRPPPPVATVDPASVPRAEETESATLLRSNTRVSDRTGPRAEAPAAGAKATTRGGDAPDGDKVPARTGPPLASRALFDERDGVTPLFLTTEQALRNYEDARKVHSLDEDMEPAEDHESLSGASSDATTAEPSWTDLGVTSPTLLENLRRMECVHPLPVQRQMLEYLLAPPNRDGVSESDPKSDVICGTMTGSGKTLSFLVPLAQRLMDHIEPSTPEPGPSPPPYVLVVAPGRELASQIVSVARDLLQDSGIAVQLAIGGTTFTRNLDAIRKRKPHIIVGTPGRLAELVAGRPGEAKGRLAKIFRPSTLVLDEFDALLEYKPHREKTLALLQVLRRDPNMQTIVCSATASDMMQRAGANESMVPKRSDRESLIEDYLRPGYRVAMAESPDSLTASGDDADQIGTRVSRTIIHGVVHVPHRRYALETLRRVLYTDPTPQQVLVFVKDSHKVKIVVERLERDGIIAAPLSGDDDKMDRADVSRALREGYVGLVVATELAARGLDAPLLTHVINMDLPTDASHYAHRAGRCGRGNRPGVVINVTTMPQERSVPGRLADKLGVDMYTVEVRNGKLNIVDPSSQTLDVR